MKRYLPVLLTLCILFCMPGTAGRARAADTEYINFSFDQADIKLLVKLVGEMTGRRFIVDPEVQGQVTVVTPARIPRDEVYPLFVSIMESSGYTVDERGAVVHIVPLPERGWLGEPVIDEEHRTSALGVQTRIIRLEHIPAAELRPVLEPMVRGGKEGAIAAFEATNHLIITDTAENIRRMEALIADLDQPGSARRAEVVPLKHASAAELAEALSRTLNAGKSSAARVSTHIKKVAAGRGTGPGDSIAIPAEHANSLVLVGSPVEVQEMKRIIEMLDVEPPAGSGRLNAVFLQYMSAEEAAKSLNALLNKRVEGDKTAVRRVAIEPDIANNALLIDAPPRDFQWVQELVLQLDQIPQQVLVEILIAEITMGTGLDLGVEWATVEEPSGDDVTFIGRTRLAESDLLMDAITQGLIPRGLSIGVSTGVDGDGNPLVPFYLTALKQSKDVNILSRVPLWAQNNKEASVSVVDNIPLLKSTIEGGAGTARDVIQNIERIDVGIQLKIVPHVNPNREVTLELNPTIEAIVDQQTGDTPLTPTISKREVKTTVTVPNEATVVISGLIRQDKIRDEHKIPLLGDIPVLGRLFKRTSDRIQRTNLLIFVRPHVVTDMRDAMRLKRELESQSTLLDVETNGVFQTRQPPDRVDADR